MLTIRLSRIGKRKQPAYRLIISEKARDTQARVLEILGSYNPFTKELNAKGERINYWLSKGSGMSVTVNNLLIDKGIIKGEKIRAAKAGKKKAAEAQAAPAPAKPETPAEAKTEEPKPETPATPEEKSAQTPATEK